MRENIFESCAFQGFLINTSCHEELNKNASQFIFRCCGGFLSPNLYCPRINYRDTKDFLFWL